MKIASLEVLENAQLPLQQGRAILHVMELELSSRMETLATREDLQLVKEDIRLLKEDIRLLKEDIRLLKEDVRLLKEDLRLVREEFRWELAEVFHKLELRIEVLRSEIVRWVFMVILGQTAVLLGAAYFFLAYFRR